MTDDGRQKVQTFKLYRGRPAKGTPSSFFSLFLGVLLGVGASEEMLMFSFLESTSEGAGRLSATVNDNQGITNLGRREIIIENQEKRND